MLLSDNQSMWSEEIIKEFLSDFPLVEKLGVDFEVLEIDPDLGNLIGILIIPGTGVGVYAIVRNGNLSPFNLGMKGKDIVIVDPEKLKSLIIKTGLGEGLAGAGDFERMNEQTGYKIEDSNGGYLGTSMTEPNTITSLGMQGIYPGLGKMAAKKNETEQIIDEALKDNDFNEKNLKGFDEAIKKFFERVLKNGKERMIRKQEKTASLDRSTVEEIVTEEILDKLEVEKKFKFASILNKKTEYSFSPETEPYEAFYENGEVYFKKAALIGGKVKEVDFLAKEMPELLEENDSRIKIAIRKGRSVPLGGETKISSIKQVNKFNNPKIEKSAGIVVIVKNNETPAITRKLFGIGGLDTQVKKMLGMGMLGLNPGNSLSFGRLSEDFSTEICDSIEDIFEKIPSAEIKPRKRVVLVTKSEMSEPLTILKKIEDGFEAFDKNKKVFKIKIDKGESNDEEKEEEDKNTENNAEENNEENKKNEENGKEKEKNENEGGKTEKRSAFLGNTIYMPSDTKIFGIDDELPSAQLQGIKFACIEENILPEFVDIEEGFTKEASEKEKIVIFINKKSSGYYVSSHYKNDGSVYSSESFSNNANDVGDELISLGVSPMRAKNLARELNKSDSTSFTIEAEINKKEKKASGEFAINEEELENLVKVSGYFGEDKDYMSMMRGFGASIIDRDQASKYKELIPEIERLKNELGEFALLKKIQGKEQIVLESVRAINSLSALEKYI